MEVRLIGGGQEHRMQGSPKKAAGPRIVVNRLQGLDVGLIPKEFDVAAMHT